MGTNIDLKSIWLQQKVEQPELTELLRRLSSYKKANLRKYAITNLFLCLTFGFIIFVWIYFQPQLISTKIGIVIVLLGIAIFLLFSNRLSRDIKKIDHTDSNQGYVEKLKALVVKQRFIQRTIMSLYFVMLSAGLCLYMYEYTIKMTLFWGCFTYIITLIWLGFNWFFTRPKIIKKQQSKLDEFIKKFENINTQLQEQT